MQQCAYVVCTCRSTAKTRMAVPYEACDLPSQRSEYKHPDTAITLAILAYYQEGLTEDALRDVVRGLSALPDGTRNSKYRHAFAAASTLCICAHASPARSRALLVVQRRWHTNNRCACRAMFALGAADASEPEAEALQLQDVDHFDKIDVDNAVQFEVRACCSDLSTAQHYTRMGGHDTHRTCTWKHTQMLPSPTERSLCSAAPVQVPALQPPRYRLLARGVRPARRDKAVPRELESDRLARCGRHGAL